MSSCGAGVIWGKMLGWLGLTVGKPQGRSLCVWGVASGSAASHPDPGSSGMVELSEESRPLSPKCRTASLPLHAFVICYGFVVKAIRDRSDEAIAELPQLGFRVRLAPSFSMAT